jgi:cyclopropane fatty-acyl-phospholipid synthase-like methyltransferase
MSAVTSLAAFAIFCTLSHKWHDFRKKTDTQMKFYKVVARPTLLYGSETWVTTTRDMTRIEAAEMRLKDTQD